MVLGARRMDACLGMSEMGSHSRNESVRKNRSPPENGKEEISYTKAYIALENKYFGTG